MNASYAPASQAGERGVALIVSLIILVLMTSFGLLAVRLITAEEKMVGHSYDRTLALQSAEAALREVEQRLEDAGRPVQTAVGCADFDSGSSSVRICSTPAPADTPRWTDSTFTQWATASSVGSGALEITPQYIVEYLGNTHPCGPNPSDPPVCKRYQITARAGGAGRAEVMLQSVYASD